jgi:hypothetical protein
MQSSATPVDETAAVSSLPKPKSTSSAPKKRKRADTDEDAADEAIDHEMKDFIVADDEADKGVVGDAEDDDDPRALIAYAAVITKSTDFAKMGTAVNEQGLRRSTRANKGVPPKVYVDEDYAALMLEGADPEDVFGNESSSDGDNEEEEDDNTAAEKRRVRELDESTVDDEDDEDDGGPDEPDEDDDFEPEEEDAAESTADEETDSD